MAQLTPLHGRFFWSSVLWVLLWHKPQTWLIQLPWPHKAGECCASSHFYKALSLCAQLGFKLPVSRKSWNKKWLYWECWMPELTLLLCLRAMCAWERDIYSMFPKLKHKPILACTCMTTWVSRASPHQHRGVKTSAAAASHSCSWSSALQLLTLELLPAIKGR